MGCANRGSGAAFQTHTLAGGTLTMAGDPFAVSMWTGMPDFRMIFCRSMMGKYERDKKNIDKNRKFETGFNHEGTEWNGSKTAFDSKESKGRFTRCIPETVFGVESALNTPGLFSVPGWPGVGERVEEDSRRSQIATDPAEKRKGKERTL